MKSYRDVMRVNRGQIKAENDSISFFAFFRELCSYLFIDSYLG